VTKPVSIFRLALARHCQKAHNDDGKLLSSLCRIYGWFNPAQGPFSDRHAPLRWHEIRKGQDHDPLSKKVAIPADKPDFSFLEVDSILVRTENQRGSGSGCALAAEFLSHG